MIDKQTFKNQDLVLKVSENVDPKIFDISKYEAFLDALCGEREYQKDAIRITLRFLLGQQYKNIRELAEENYHQNPKLQEKYSSLEDFYQNLQIPEKLSCTLDLATGTGKSYILYGLARIMLAEGAADQVLILCPSTTIEEGLTDKFRLLSTDKTLKDLVSHGKGTINPSIINATETIKKGDICIENRHATYKKTKSAIDDSLIGKGKKTLVLNDEVHHVYNGLDQQFKKWKEFLLDPKFNFKYIVGNSGTCYIGDEYFSDVVYRYPIGQAIEEKQVKSVRYVAEDSSGSEDEKFQKIYDNHIQNKTIKYRKIKPLTILVTKDISRCKILTKKLIKFLFEKEKISPEEAARKVLIVTSAPENKNNIPLLKEVDDQNNPIEWITSVSMLSEGWDVKNVLQIVPHEERAFNSKLLIAQVLGRGLRIPDQYKGDQPICTVFNHDKWSSSIKHLVEEVLEIEKKIYSYPVTKDKNYSFKLYNIDYTKEPFITNVPQQKEFELLKKGYITYSSQIEAVEKATTYVRVLTGDREEKKTLIEYKMFSPEETAQEILNKLKVIDQDLGTTYSKKFTKEKILEIIKKSLRKVGEREDWVSQENLQKTLQAFGVARRPGTKVVRYEIKEQGLVKLSTDDLKKVSLGVGSLRRDSTIFFDDDSFKTGEEKDQKILRELLEDETLLRSSLYQVENKYNFKNPCNIELAAYAPEREFIKRLVAEDNAKSIDAWIKSPDVGFYSIEYSWRKGEHPKQGKFNPDFFIKKGNDILVVEIKMDTDTSDENKAKLKYAREHFERINKMQKEQHYCFKFLSPESYDNFFYELRNNNYQLYKSKLEADLE